MGVCLPNQSEVHGIAAENCAFYLGYHTHLLVGIGFVNHITKRMFVNRRWAAPDGQSTCTIGGAALY